MFVGAVSSGLVALGFVVQSDAGDGGTASGIVLLTALVLLGTRTFLLAVQASIDDAVVAERIERLRDVYVQLVPQLGTALAAARGDEQSTLLGRRSGAVQMLLTVAGTLGALTAVLAGGDLGLLVYGVTSSLAAGLAAGTVAGVIAAVVSSLVQRRSWQSRRAAPPAGGGLDAPA